MSRAGGMLTDPAAGGKGSTSRALAWLIILSAVTAWWLVLVVILLTLRPEPSVWSQVGPCLTQMWPLFIAAVGFYGINVSKDVAKSLAGRGGGGSDE